MDLYPTPHIKATPEDFAETVLMPGDPLRAKRIAENYLENAALINEVRGMLGYTGYYKGKRVTVMASGMGCPSMGIYSWELFNVFGVRNIIRIGSAGSMREDVLIRDVVLALGASTDSSYGAQFRLPGTFAPVPSWELLRVSAEQCEKLGARYHVGNVLTSDAFYTDNRDATDAWAKMGVLCVEMEAASLYMNAARAGKRALAILTVSDSVITGETTTSEERQTSFTQMVEIALNTAISI